MTNFEWSNLVKMHQKRVFSVALSVLRNVEDAKEITQDVFIKLYTHMDTIKDAKSISGWLAKTCYNSAINKVRAARLKQWIFGTDEIDKAASHTSSQEDVMSTSQELHKMKLWRKARLSKKENVIIQLKHGEEMTLQEIAEFLGMSVSSVKTHYYRAKKKVDLLLSSKKGNES